MLDVRAIVAGALRSMPILEGNRLLQLEMAPGNLLDTVTNASAIVLQTVTLPRCVMCSKVLPPP
jgi:hypothetical protein